MELQLLLKKLRRARAKTERDEILLRKGEREFHRWIVEGKKRFQIRGGSGERESKVVLMHTYMHAYLF